MQTRFFEISLEKVRSSTLCVVLCQSWYLANGNRLICLKPVEAECKQKNFAFECLLKANEFPLYSKKKHRSFPFCCMKMLILIIVPIMWFTLLFRLFNNLLQAFRFFCCTFSYSLWHKKSLFSIQNRFLIHCTIAWKAYYTFKS